MMPRQPTLFGREPAAVAGGPQPGSPLQEAGAPPEVLFRPDIEREAPSFTETFSTAFSLDSPVASLARLNESAGLPIDPDFALTSEVQNEMVSDVPGPLHLDLLDTLTGATSQRHADVLKNQFLTEVDRERTLQEAGMGGLATRLLANVVDPVNLALAFGTGGLGVVTKAKALQGAIKLGAWTAAENAAIETAVVASSHTRGADDVLFSALGGFVLGGAVGGALGRFGPDLARATQTAATRQTDEVGREALDGAGLDSAGAKRVEGYTEPLMEREVAQRFDIDDAADIPEAAFGGARFDAVGRLGINKDPFVRDLSRALAEESTGVKGHGVVRYGASERAALTHRTIMADFRRTSEPEFGNWIEETGGNWGHRYSLAKRDDFFQEVGKAVREGGQHPSPAIQKAAQSTQRVLSRYLDELKKADVAGFKDIPKNSRYLPRIFNQANIREFVSKYGGDGLEKLVRAGMKSFDPDIEDDIIRKVAKGYVTKIRRLASGMDAGLTHGINLDDVDFLKSMLRDTDLDEDAIEAVLLGVTKRTEASKTSRAKRRMDIDEGVTVSVRNTETGEIDVRSASDILENNAEKLLFGYSRSMSGWVGLARQAGIKSPADVGKVRDIILSRAESRGAALEDVEETVKRYDFLVNGITGVPLETDPASLFAKGARALRDLNFLRIGAAFGFAQLAEIGNVLGTVGLRNTISQVPELRKMIKRGVDGKLEGALARDIEDMLAPGTDRILNQASTRWEEHGFDAAGKGSVSRSIDNAVQVAKRATSDIGGLNAATLVFQRMAASGIAQKLAGFANGAKLSAAQVQRMKGMGISDEMWDRISAQLRNHATTRESFVPGRKKLVGINPSAWDDADALDNFTLAVHREARRVVQENDIGASTPWLHTTTGKILTQFRTFALTSWSKATLHGVHHRDLQSFSILNYSMFMGGLAYIAQQSLNTADPKKRAEKLSVEEIAKASFQRTAMASIVPGLVDTAMTTAFRQDPMFAFGRSSGLATGFINGNPTVDAIDKLTTIAGLPAVAARPDVEMTKRDYRSLTGMLPVLGGLVGVRRTLDALAGDIAE